MEKQLQLLRRLKAPDALIEAFVEVCKINETLPGDHKATYVKLLQEQCRRFGFSDVLDDGWFFRPYATQGKDSRDDSAVYQDHIEAPAIEQAYRRGYDQGFDECLRIAQKGSLSDARERGMAISKWRKRAVQQFGSRPGSSEVPPRNFFVSRINISAGVRWQVFQRDNRKCVVCGASASTGAELHIDHIVPISKGGNNKIENLQTLCATCNLGKSDRLEGM